jgi:hypothetical protein
MIRTQICPECQQEFSFPAARGTHRVCCSPTCQHERTKRRQRLTGVRTRTCEVCQQAFSYAIRRGRDRRICGKKSCQQARRLALLETKPRCITPGCTNPQGYSNGICNSCYYRWRRTGTLERRTWKRRRQHSNGYIVLISPQHPLATPRAGLVYEHRKVLYDTIGPGSHPCHWCGVMVEWRIGTCRKGTLVADHLDGNKTNNDPRNLVAACNQCNVDRVRRASCHSTKTRAEQECATAGRGGVVFCRIALAQGTAGAPSRNIKLRTIDGQP